MLNKNSQFIYKTLSNESHKDRLRRKSFITCDVAGNSIPATRHKTPSPYFYSIVLITQMHWEQEYQLSNALQDEYEPIIQTRSGMSKGKKTTILEFFSAQLELSEIRLYHSIEVIELYLERWLGALERTRRRI